MYAHTHTHTHARTHTHTHTPHMHTVRTPTHKYNSHIPGREGLQVHIPYQCIYHIPGREGIPVHVSQTRQGGHTSTQTTYQYTCHMPHTRQGGHSVHMPHTRQGGHTRHGAHIPHTSTHTTYQAGRASTTWSCGIRTVRSSKVRGAASCVGGTPERSRAAAVSAPANTNIHTHYGCEFIH